MTQLSGIEWETGIELEAACRMIYCYAASLEANDVKNEPTNVTQCS